MPNVNVTHGEMQSAARQLQTGQQLVNGDLSRLRRLVGSLVAGGYVTDEPSRQSVAMPFRGAPAPRDQYPQAI